MFSIDFCEIQSFTDHWVFIPCAIWNRFIIITDPFNSRTRKSCCCTSQSVPIKFLLINLQQLSLEIMKKITASALLQSQLWIAAWYHSDLLLLLKSWMHFNFSSLLPSKTTHIILSEILSFHSKTFHWFWTCKDKLKEDH